MYLQQSGNILKLNPKFSVNKLTKASFGKMNC